MKHATSHTNRATRWAVGLTTVIISLGAPSHRLEAQRPVPPPPAPAATASAFSTVQGFVMDSVHNSPLAGADVIVEGASRSGMTNADGHYRIDSVPPGQHRIMVLHPVLDTLGIQMRTPAYAFVAGQSHELDLTIPGGERLASALCNSVWRARGPAVLVGFVRDPDTNGPALGSKVSLVYNEVDIIGRKKPIVRETPVDSSGFYRICGLPGDMSGKVQVFRNGVSSGEVPAEVTNGFVALRAFSIVAQHQAVVEVKSDSGKLKRYAKGSARVTGKVVDKRGQPLRDARVMLQGGGTVAITKPNGEFVLDSLPSGTQALDVRKLGYSATEVAVELSANTPAATTITMSDAVPMLETMRVEAAQDKALSDIGYLQRKQSGFGRFYDGKQINHQSLSFSDVMRMDPGLRISPTGDGRTYTITDGRSATSGCVNFYVDGTLWQQMTPGDIDNYVQPSELVAIEVYHGSETPPQYSPPGQSGCATIVAWTVARVRPQTTRNKRP
jgi:Carboxypeptidase regulatory-like domain